MQTDEITQNYDCKILINGMVSLLFAQTQLNNELKKGTKGNDTNFDRLGCSMYFSKLYPFVLLSRLLNVLGETCFLVYNLLTPFSHACYNLRQ